MSPSPGRRAGWLASAVAVALLVAGCAHLGIGAGGGGEEGPTAADRFERALDLDRAGEHAAAARALAVAARSCGTEPLGQQAVLALAALELDPRYGEGSPERAARLALRLLERPSTAPWTGRMASTLYLAASELRADTARLEPAAVGELYPDAGGPGQPADCAPLLAAGPSRGVERPRLPDVPLAVRAERLRTRVDSLSAELTPLRERVRALVTQVESLASEVERLRSLLEPPEEPR